MKTAKSGVSRIAEKLSVKGYSHKLNGKPCQDSSSAWSEERYSAIIVCDGHGGDKYIYSADGSKLACEYGQSMIRQFMSDIYSVDGCILNRFNADDMLTHLEQSIITQWRKQVEKKNPLEGSRFTRLSPKDQESLLKNPVKAFGTTFIAAVLADEFCFVLQLGDGNALFYHADGKVEDPAELADDTLQFNLTTSMCNSDAAQSFRHCFRSNEDGDICGVTLTSDGVANCYRSIEQYASFMKNVYLAFGEDGPKAAAAELKDVLRTLSEKGSGDDLSVAIVRDCPTATKLGG